MRFFLRPLVKAEEFDPKKGNHALCAICKKAEFPDNPLFSVVSPMTADFVAHRECVKLDVKP